MKFAQELFDDARDTATKVVLLLSDGTQSPNLGYNGLLGSAAAMAAGKDLRDDGAKVFAWGFGIKVDASALEGIAGDVSRVRYASNVSGLSQFLNGLEDDVCNFSPPTSPPSPMPSLLPSITWVTGTAGGDCNAACEAVPGRTCFVADEKENWIQTFDEAEAAATAAGLR